MYDLNLNHLAFGIADPSAHMRKIIRTILVGFGVGRIYEAADGASALEIVESQMPDMLITETRMPIIDGFEVMQMIRNPDSSKCPYVPIIVATAQTEKKNILKIRNAGATEILGKPFSITGLYLRIQNIVVNPRIFVSCDGFFGPDRRRRIDPGYTGPFRRSEDETPTEETTEMPMPRSEAG